jgi:hypothetical protein
LRAREEESDLPIAGAPAFTQSGVRAGGEAYVPRGPLQHVDELAMLAGFQDIEDFAFELIDCGVGFVESGVGLRRQVQLVGTPIARVSFTSNQTAALEVVDQADHVVAVDSHRIGELLLAEQFSVAEFADDSVVSGVESERLKLLRAACRYVKAELRQQKRSTSIERRTRTGFQFFHLPNVL